MNEGYDAYVKGLSLEGFGDGLSNPLIHIANAGEQYLVMMYVEPGTTTNLAFYDNGDFVYADVGDLADAADYICEHLHNKYNLVFDPEGGNYDSADAIEQLEGYI